MIACSQRVMKKEQIKQNQCDCLARLQTEPLRALLFLRSSPLRRLAAATLRKRPVLLRLDEVAELLLPLIDL